jgi:hypothetical protein
MSRAQVDDLSDRSEERAHHCVTVGFIVGGVGVAAGSTLLVMYLGERFEVLDRARTILSDGIPAVRGRCSFAVRSDL